MALKRFIKQTAGRLGYAVIDKSMRIPADVRRETDNPLTAKYLARKSMFVINADVKNCISLWRFSCEVQGKNPFVNIVSAYLRGEDVRYQGSGLEKYYSKFQPENVAEMFELDGALNKDLTALKAVYFIQPWEAGTMEGKKKYREQSIR